MQRSGVFFIIFALAVVIALHVCLADFGEKNGQKMYARGKMNRIILNRLHLYGRKKVWIDAKPAAAAAEKTTMR